jgi:hypothetical protein
LQYFFNTSSCADVRANHLDSLMKVNFKCHWTLSIIRTRHLVTKHHPLMLWMKRTMISANLETLVEAYSKYEYSLFLVNLSVETEELH